MEFLDRFRKKNQHPGAAGGPSSIARQLDSYARCETASEFVGSFDRAHKKAIGTNLYLTKAAITIQWLRILKQGADGPTTVASSMLLDEFEDLTFSPPQQEVQMALIEHIRKLMSLTVKLQKCVDNSQLSKDEIARQIIGISKEWFGLMFNDEDLLCRLSLTHGAPLLLVINAEIANIAKMVESAVGARSGV